MVNCPICCPPTPRPRRRRPDESWLIDEPDLAVPLPPARRDQGRPVDLAQPQADRHCSSSSTRPEFASIAGDDTPYVFTRKVRAHRPAPVRPPPARRPTGSRTRPRDLVLVAPTWRTWLTSSIDPGTQRAGAGRGLAEPVLRARVGGRPARPADRRGVPRRGVTLGFLPHPIMQPMLPDRSTCRRTSGRCPSGRGRPGPVCPVRGARDRLLLGRLQRRLPRAPVVYFQFDPDAVLAGEHIGRAGYFDYERDGFGPVATSTEAAIEAIVAQIAHGPRPTP